MINMAIQVNGKIIKKMVEAHIFILMVKSIKEIG